MRDANLRVESFRALIQRVLREGFRHFGSLDQEMQQEDGRESTSARRSREREMNRPTARLCNVSPSLLTGGINAETRADVAKLKRLTVEKVSRPYSKIIYAAINVLCLKWVNIREKHVEYTPERKERPRFKMAAMNESQSGIEWSKWSGSCSAASNRKTRTGPNGARA
jgi:hypothetical protein